MSVMRYKLHIAFRNREDLLRDAVESVRDIGNIHLWPNNGAADPGIADTAVRVLPDMSAVDTINMMIQSSWDDDVMFWMHNDALALPGVAPRVLQHVEELHASDKRWGVMFTMYDVLCAFNMRAVREIGYWDPMFFQYTADVEYYHRMNLAGWSFEEFGPGVLHRVGEPMPGVIDDGSATVRSDPVFNLRTQWRERSGFDKAYYKLKWGSLPGQPKDAYYDRPFGDSIR